MGRAVVHKGKKKPQVREASNICKGIKTDISKLYKGSMTSCLCGSGFDKRFHLGSLSYEVSKGECSFGF